jgi:hypothetical protein
MHWINYWLFGDWYQELVVSLLYSIKSDSEARPEPQNAYRWIFRRDEYDLGQNLNVKFKNM